MSKTPEPTPPSQPKRLSLDALLPEKAPVDTTLGTLYVRHAYASDWKYFESDDATELGKAAVRQLTNQNKDKKEDGPLADEDFNALTERDFDALAPIIAKRSSWGEMSAGPALERLGQSLIAAKERERERHNKMLDDLRKSIGGSYGFLSKSSLEKLQDQVTGLADIRKSMSGTDALKEAMREIGRYDDVLKATFTSTRAIDEVTRGINQQSIPKAFEPRAIESQRIHMPRPEDTPIGRAALESAQHSREVAKNIDALASVVGGLNQTLVTEVLPSWFRQVESAQENAKHSQDSAQRSLEQAASGLWWTKWAVIVSVVVSVLVTWWQVSVTRSIDRENSAQQQKLEALLREQLTAQQKLIEQQARDAGQLRELLEQQDKNSGRNRVERGTLLRRGSEQLN